MNSGAVHAEGHVQPAFGASERAVDTDSDEVTA